MERVIERGAGLDVHKKTVADCLRVPGSHGERIREVRTFGTTAAELLALRDWLGAHGVTHAAMERTGVYRRVHLSGGAPPHEDGVAVLAVVRVEDVPEPAAPPTASRAPTSSSRPASTSMACRSRTITNKHDGANPPLSY